MPNRPKPLVLLILDGFGYSMERENNAIAMANTPSWDQLQKDYPMTLLDCSGRSVGLPDDQMGNSEVGHIHIGTGRYVQQDFPKINDAILFDLAPTMLAILGVEQPAKMTGRPLVNAA